MSVSAFDVRDSDATQDTQHLDAGASCECALWKLWLETEQKAARTIDDYERTVAKLLRANMDVKFGEFTDRHIMECLVSFPSASRRVRRAHLKSWFTWGVLTRRLDRNPLDLIPRIRRPGQRLIEVFTDRECDALEGLPIRDGALFTLMLHAGLRKGECLRLQRKHISLDQLTISVYRGKGDKDRVIPFGPNSAITRAILDHDLIERLNPNDYMWYRTPGGASVISRTEEPGQSTFHNWYTKRLEAAGVAYRARTKTEPGLHNPHVTRHTMATRWLRNGGRLETLSIILGHTSIKTTFDLYGWLDQRDVREDLALIEARL